MSLRWRGARARRAWEKIAPINGETHASVIYADYQPSAGEAELVERAFGQGAKRGAKLSETAPTSGDPVRLDQAESDLT